MLFVYIMYIVLVGLNRHMTKYLSIYTAIFLMNEAYVLLNVDYKHLKNIIEQAKQIPVAKSVKTVYGICDVLVILESDDMQKIKDAIDNDLHNMQGITNLTSLIAVS